MSTAELALDATKAAPEGAAQERLGYRPGLDGLRAVAVAIVVVAHTSTVPGLPMLGGVGVGLFFTLSGFLITTLLFEEQARGRVSLRRFYARRARRLLPALPLVLLFGAVVHMGLSRPVGRELFAAVTYTSNLWGWDAGAFRHLWSLAVEEQFYLWFPALFLVTRPRTWAWIAVVVAVSRLIVATDGNAEWLYRVWRWDALLAGCVLAAWWRTGRRVPWHRTVWLVLFAAAALNTAGFMRVGTLAVTAASVLLVARYVENPPRWLTHPVMLRLGVISYGVYLWHYPISWWVRISTFDPLARLVFTAIPTLIAAELSYRLIEAPLRRHRDVVLRPEVRADTAPLERC